MADSPISRTTARLLVAAAAVAGGLLVVGLGFVIYSWQPTVVADTEAAAVELAELAPQLRVPDDLHPRETIAMEVLFTLPLRGVTLLRDDYGGLSDQGPPDDLLLVLQMTGPAATNPAMRVEALQTLRGQGPIQTTGFTPVGTPESITTIVDDREREAIVTTLARPDRSQVRQAQLLLDAEGGPLVLVLRRPPDRFDVNEIRRLIESVPWRS